jgi:cytochrome c oxidase subunit 2
LHTSLVALGLLLLGGCEGWQSALDASGPEARNIAILSWIMFTVSGLLLALVTGLFLFAAFAPEEKRRPLASGRFILLGGVALPVILLTALLVYGLSLTARGAPAGGAPGLRIEVTGEQWWWRVHYPAEGSGPAFATANEIRIPVGTDIQFTLHSADVIHSFWVPKLGGKLDMVPGQANTFRLKATEAGTFRGQCAEYCGGAHALMAFQVIALEPDAFAAWRAAQAQPASPPEDPVARRGRETFLSTGCGACHTLRGLPAEGRIGPDLTHVGGRQTIGAGLLRNDAAALAEWIAGARHVKPGNRMPSFPILSGEELNALATYLAGLK